MANKKDNQQQNVSNSNQGNKTRKGDTGRSSDGGRKAASGGSTNTNNRGQQKGT